LDTLGTPATTAGGTAYQRLRVAVTLESTTQGFAEFSVDGVNIGTVHFDYASATEMQLFVGCKNGSAHAETLNVDKFGYGANR
jgi:hypothetical protein